MRLRLRPKLRAVKDLMVPMAPVVKAAVSPADPVRVAMDPMVLTAPAVATILKVPAVRAAPVRAAPMTEKADQAPVDPD